jgi:hypothetical protein
MAPGDAHRVAFREHCGEKCGVFRRHRGQHDSQNVDAVEVSQPACPFSVSCPARSTMPSALSSRFCLRYHGSRRHVGQHQILQRRAKRECAQSRFGQIGAQNFRRAGLGSAAKIGFGIHAVTGAWAQATRPTRALYCRILRNRHRFKVRKTRTGVERRLPHKATIDHDG